MIFFSFFSSINSYTYWYEFKRKNRIRNKYDFCLFIENPPMNESNAEPSSTESTENTPLAHGTQPQTLAINTDEDSNIFSRDNFN